MNQAPFYVLLIASFLLAVFSGGGVLLLITSLMLFTLGTIGTARTALVTKNSGLAVQLVGATVVWGFPWAIYWSRDVHLCDFVPLVVGLVILDSLLYLYIHFVLNTDLRGEGGARCG